MHFLSIRAGGCLKWQPHQNGPSPIHRVFQRILQLESSRQLGPDFKPRSARLVHHCFPHKSVFHSLLSQSRRSLGTSITGHCNSICPRQQHSSCLVLAVPRSPLARAPSISPPSPSNLPQRVLQKVLVVEIDPCYH